MGDRELVFAEEFDGAALDTSVWLPHYLPAWSSQAETAASYDVADSCLRLFIPPEQGLWCAETHTPPLRVSGIQSGNFSGPVGSTHGQQAFRDGLTVREEQEEFWGWTPDGGYLEMRLRGTVTARSMLAIWMTGLEKDPRECAEICPVEIFGNAVTPTTTEVGMGLKALGSPDVPQDFVAVPLPLDVAEFHTYAVDWTADAATFLVDGVEVRSCPRPPSYAVQVMVAVFDFPDWSTGDDADAVPELVVDHIRGYRAV